MEMSFVTRNHAKLTAEGAKAVLAAAEKRAAEIRVPMNIAVVDDGGHLMAFTRMDGAKLSSVQIAIVKAHASAIRRKPSGPAMTGEQPNTLLSLALAVGSEAHQTPIRGGVPLLVGGEIVGAVGASNGTEDEDVDVAQAGAAALANA
jgi:glc operon protein GlcG